MLKGKWLPILLLLFFGLLQYRLWFGKNSIPDYYSRKAEVQTQALQNANLAQRNALLNADINDLKIGLEAIEERARNELGLIKQGETFYRILPADSK
ncbi:MULTISPECIES: cell division protein FtsB [Alteromonas]|uniref:Cell division protein FtsB n=1 Tax=Alteromonas hispanica TaxID=315421 RepID=A0A6L9MUU9_9ALTE|nr:MULTISPECIES: cell division protein FtsB [unclassified Alteromonas]APE04837.1 cell division protein FtsB [Alteromonas sp. RW2A1]AUC87233.1 cell division protein FtsB [Alteromonas sp. MB-3u-76]MAI64600.1 cell division protein FtsB [Alteromonas sp.]NDW21928.1 cell division protein FtsB [Alteromonas hispanica]